jgi:bifunctional enzyme CysN/CysC
MDLLRFATAGSVDDGKSTLIGRLLYDTKSIFQDQLDAVERTSIAMGSEYVNLALLTDGLRAEREQGITIDVAYRYFATPNRKFIIADTPGHKQYTRNMVTGASTADLALVLIDARNGVVEQSRRHAAISGLLRIPHVVVCVNKMDLVDFDEAVFDAVVKQFSELAETLGLREVTYIPVSALRGDNVVEPSTAMPWYTGLSLLQHLESVPVVDAHHEADARFPVQYVLRPYSDEYHDYRGLAGTVASGVFRPGDAVTVLPSGQTTTIDAIDSMDGTLDAAAAPMAITLRLTDDLDVSRGDMICPAAAPSAVGQDIEAMVCWMSERSSLNPGAKLGLKHTTNSVRAIVRTVTNRLEIASMAQDEAVSSLQLNDIGRITLRTTQPLMYDDYRTNRTTGSFILIDEATMATVGAGMILGPAKEPS